MNLSRRIYRLSPSQFSAETIAVTFAKTSRSPEAFDQIAAELDAEKSSKFSEKWIVGYGHSSVAEHAVLHLALENISRLAIETLESNRLASYTEKSTRYQEWNPEAWLLPPEIAGSRFEERYRRVMGLLFHGYAEAMTALRAWSESATGRLPEESEKAWQNRARVKAVDVGRFFLPAASMANVGVTINARALEYAIKKLLSSELEEVRQIGSEVKTVAEQELPTLVKHANPIESLPGIREGLRAEAGRIAVLPGADWCRLLGAEPAGEEQVLAAALLRFSGRSYAECLAHVRGLADQEKAALVQEILGHLGDFDTPLRELEYAHYDFELVMDQGAYFEFKRHRMMTQTAQPLTTRLGYAVPRAMSLAGVESLYRQAMDAAAELYEALSGVHPEAAAYVVPNGYNRRVLCRMNLRELFHFTKLRASANAHFSIRRAALRMAELAVGIHPLFCSALCLPVGENADWLTDEYFTEVAVLPLGSS
ncbi:MAG TPA: FAD-dependent thymidylate synthase [Anaerolineaceae bacterium]|nr:FAD-dependent thymidylate synthase [Anaerolineaceae bacterium]HPS32477.1 FAD-dependent thymidylate synthase [Anaerolineaceae bacterium]